MKEIKTAAVFCGSHDSQPKYREAAAALGRYLAETGITLVFGGSDCGTMKVVADSALDAGGHVVGVSTFLMSDRHPVNPRLTDVIRTKSLADRKAEMIARADIIIALPGGFGTWDEMFDALALYKTHQSPAPVGVLNVDHYYDKLLSFISDSVEAGFTFAKDRELLVSADTPAALVATLAARVQEQ